MLDCELIWVQWILGIVQICLLIDVGELFKLLLDTAEFDSALNCSFGEDFLGVWEGGHEILQFLLLQTVSIGGVLHGGLVGLRGTQAHQDLVVTKVVGWV